MYKRILLPTDGTEFCERALRHGIDLAKILQATVAGVTVTQPVHSALPFSLVPKTLLGTIQGEIAKMANEKLSTIERLAETAGGSVRADAYEQ